MLTPTNWWMSIAGILYLAVGAFMFRKELSAARGVEKLVTLGPVFIGASLVAFAPEHFKGPDFVRNMVPKWMPLHLFWVYLVGCALIAAATSLVLRKFERLSSTLLGLMFFLFVCMIYLPSLIRHPTVWLAWVILCRDLTFAGGTSALAGFYRQSKFLVTFGRIAVAVAAIVFGVDYFLHPALAPGVPLQLKTPSWVPLPMVWTYLTAAILLVGGIALLLNKRWGAVAIGVLMTVITLFPYTVMLIRALRGSPDDINEALNYVADTLLYAGAALALASAMPIAARNWRATTGAS